MFTLISKVKSLNNKKTAKIVSFDTTKELKGGKLMKEKNVLC